MRVKGLWCLSYPGNTKQAITMPQSLLNSTFFLSLFYCNNFKKKIWFYLVNYKIHHQNCSVAILFYFLFDISCINFEVSGLVCWGGWFCFRMKTKLHSKQILFIQFWMLILCIEVHFSFMQYFFPLNNYYFFPTWWCSINVRAIENLLNSMLFEMWFNNFLNAIQSLW